MFFKYNIKKFLGFYKNQPSVWIKVIQTDGVEYFCEVNKENLKDEINRVKEFSKKIIIL